MSDSGLGVKAGTLIFSKLFPLRSEAVIPDTRMRFSWTFHLDVTLVRINKWLKVAVRPCVVDFVPRRVQMSQHLTQAFGVAGRGGCHVTRFAPHKRPSSQLRKAS